MLTNTREINLCRIVFNLTNSTGGSSVHCLELSQNIDFYLKHQFIITADSDKAPYPIHNSFLPNIYKVKFLRFTILKRIKTRFIPILPVAPLVRISFGVSAFFKCIELNRLYGIDIIHVHGIGNAIVTTFLKHFTHRPTVLMLHGSLGSYSKLSGIYESLVLRMTSFSHYFILDHGGPILTKACEIVPRKAGFTTVPVNIDIIKYRSYKPNRQIVFDLGIEDKFVFISVHSLEPVQGVEFTLQAFSSFIKKYLIINAVLLVIGDGSQKQKLKDMVDKLDLNQYVLFVGRVASNSIPYYFSVAHVALSTSTSVNMNRSTHEAMACNKPVIAFNTGNTTDKLIKHMERGILVTNRRIDKLARAMYLLYSNKNLRKKLGTNARTFIEKNRCWKERIKIELNVYKQLLRKRYK